MGKGQVLTDVQARGRVAYDCGYATFNTDLDPSEVKRSVQLTGGVHLNPGERDAYAQLSPGVWWAYWTRGWADAAGRAIINELRADG